MVAEQLARHGCPAQRVRTLPEAAGVRIAYAEPSRLGVDRFLALLGAHARGPGPWLLVSAGSALTVDLLDSSGQHRGGVIAPSPEHMRAALAARFAPGAVAAMLAARFAGRVAVTDGRATMDYATLSARAHALGRTVILNPAPAVGPLPAHWYGLVDYLIPNESEASALSCLPVDSRETAEIAASRLIAMGTGKVIILPVDQGFEHGPARNYAVNPEAYDPHYHYKLAKPKSGNGDWVSVTVCC